MLEHAFDSILEAGEVPPLSFFTEMVCEATIQHDHERVVNIVNAMAHASFQVSLQEWINHFERNRDRMNRACLNELEEKLVSHDLLKEATALNFSRALQIICGSCDDSQCSTESTSPAMDDQNPGARFGNTCNSNKDWNLNIKDTDSDEESGLLDYNLESKSSAVCSDDVKFERIEHDEWEPDDDEEFNFEHIIPNNEEDDDDWRGSNTPSALEILETWRNK